MPNGETLKRIVCFGDSNTWGYDPESANQDLRFPIDTRWTGLVQDALPDCLIIEEGLNSRTTNIDDPDAEGKNGFKTFPGIVRQHYPVDLIILMLGTNDLKKKFNRTAEQIALGLEEIVRYATKYAPHSLLIVSPPIPKLHAIYDSYRYETLENKARSLAPLYEKLALKYNANSINAADYVVSSETDGAHLDAEEHRKLAEVLTNFIRSRIVG